MWLMCGDKVLAKTYKRGQMTAGLRLEDNIRRSELPIGLFPDNATDIGIDKFRSWISNRMVPEERDDIDKLLAEMDMSDYYPMEIARKNNARARYRDNFWVDFTDGTVPRVRVSCRKDIQDYCEQAGIQEHEFCNPIKLIRGTNILEALAGCIHNFNKIDLEVIDE